MVEDFRALHFRTVGASHIKANKVCQDYAQSAEKQGLRYAAVCDGHGGADYFRSDRGSRFAAKCFAALMDNRDFTDALHGCVNEKARGEIVGQFVKCLICRWNSMVDDDIEREPFTDDELCGVSEKARRRYESGERMQSAYGTTLIGAVLTDTFWLGVQIGDGKCVTVSESGRFSSPIPWDEECFLNITTSMCDENAAAEFRYYYDEALPAAIFLGSDGIDDCFAGDEKLNDFYRVVLKSFADADAETAYSELEQYLPALSERGSGDDMSLAMIMNMKFIKDNAALLCTKTEIFLEITRSGDFGGDGPNDEYYQTACIKAVPGIYSLEDIGCGGFHEGTREIELLSVSDTEISVRINGNLHTVMSDMSVELSVISRQTSYDGPSWTAEDVLELKMLRK